MVLCVTMAAAVLAASFVVFLVREAESRSKHVQVRCVGWSRHILCFNGCSISPRMQAARHLQP